VFVSETGPAVGLTGVKGSHIKENLLKASQLLASCYTVIAFYLAGITGVQAQVTIWSEDFATNSNNDIIGNDNNAPAGADWTTSCPTCNRVNEFRVEGNRMRVENTDEIATWTSEIISIAGYTGVDATVSIDMDDNQFDATDCITISYKLDGGAQTQFPTNGNLCDDGIDPTIASVTGLNGTTIQIIIEAITTNNNEDLHFDDIFVTGDPSPTLINGPGSGNTLDFDGSNDYVEISSSFPDMGGQSFTITAWVKPDDLGSTGQRIWCDDETNSSGGYALSLGDPGSGRLRFYTRGVSPISLDVPAANSLTLGEWSHVAVVHNATAGTKQIYINSILVASATYTGTLANAAGPSSIGGETNASSESGNRFDGQIDEVSFWTAALTQTNLRDNMCKKLIGSEANLIGYWRFDESSGSILADHASSYHSQLTNMAPASDWVTSGAPLGNTSTHLYTTSWTGQSVYLASQEGDSLGVSAVSGIPNAIHIYNVDELPNVTAGTDGLGANNQYFGVFKVDGTTPTYTATYYYRENDAYQIGAVELGVYTYIRDNNADLIWTDPSPTLNITTKTLDMPAMNTEFILGNTVSPLPIDLIHFEANANTDKVDLQWITASEINNDYFTVERSNDAVTWEDVLLINGAGNSNTTIAYYETDYEPLQGISYYRLKQTDFDGSFLFSAIVSVNFESESPGTGILRVFPCPVTAGEKIQVMISNMQAPEVLLELRDLTGRTLRTSIVSTLDQQHKLTSITTVADMSAGVYLLTASTGKQLLSKRVIIL